MSFKVNNYQQIRLDDNFLSLSERVRKLVENSWAKDFADIVFPAINEERFAVLYSEQAFSRPNTPVNFIVGALMLKELNGLTDDELVASIWCDVRYQYALHSTSYEEQPVSDRTFSRFRERLYNYEVNNKVDLLSEEMKHLAEEYSTFMKLRKGVKRMDSLMIASRSKALSRIQILYRTVAGALKLMHRLGFDSLIPGGLFHYLEPDDENLVIYHSKGDDAGSRLEQVMKDALQVFSLMSDDSWYEFQEYQLLERVLREQTTFDPENDALALKENKEITAQSLQNPSDPDATYREKAGKGHKGYVGNLVESIGENGDSVITDFDYKTNDHSDSDFCKEYLESRPDDAEHETMITDGAFGGEENRALAESKNVELVATALTGVLPDPVFAEFEMDAKGERVVRCPAGHEPLGTTYYEKQGICRARFAKDHCCNCPHRDKCRALEQKKNYVVMVSAKKVARAQYLKTLSTELYRQLTRQRNAIEGIPSVLRRKYRIDEIPVFGYIRSKMFFVLKLGAYNIQKLCRHCARSRRQSALLAGIA